MREIEIALSFFPEGHVGTILDIGSGSLFLSLTHELEKAGWEVYCFEGNPYMVEKTRRSRKNIFWSAIGDRCENNVPFYVYRVMFDMASFSGLTEHDIDAFNMHGITKKSQPEIVHVPLRTVDYWLEELSIKKVDIAIIDTEGSELEVLQGFSLDKHRPRVLIVENWFLNGRPYLNERGYNLIETVAYNEVYMYDR